MHIFKKYYSQLFSHIKRDFMNIYRSPERERFQFIEAYHYRKSNKGVICELCPHECELKEGKTGKCLVRKNIDGKLIALNYGNTSALNIDPIEKKPLYHFLPSTESLSIGFNGCNLRCKNCQNNCISQASSEIGRYGESSPESIVNLAKLKRCKSISYTYTEPLVSYEFILETCKLAHKESIRNVIVSAGYINPQPLRELIPYVDAFNIDLKSINKDVYRKLCKVKLKHILTTLEIIRDSECWLEITNLIIPGYSDSFEDIQSLCRWLEKNNFENVPLHFSRFYPHHELSHINPTPYKTLLEAKEIASMCGIEHIYIGNVRNTGDENTFCPNCRELLIERDGFSITKNLLQKNKCFRCKKNIDGVFT